MRKGKWIPKAVAVCLCAAMLSADAPSLSAAQNDAVTEVSVIKAAGYYDTVEDAKMADGYYIRKVSKADIAANGIRALQAALSEAAENATDKVPYKVVVEPGKYTSDFRLVISSNTYLYMDGVTITQAKNTDNNMITVGMKNGPEKGYCYKNITIYGGTFDKGGNAGTTLMKLGHTAGFTMENVNFVNITNAHVLEVGGVDGFTMRGCTVKDQKVNASTKIDTYEAIQFDVLVEGHISGYEFEDLANQNITIENCTFNNVSRAIGSHNAILNNPIRNISIKNNTFTKLKSVAISFMDPRNCEISSNTITGGPRGIMIVSPLSDGVYLASTLNKGTVISTKYIKPEADQKIVISGNKISCSGQDPNKSSPTSCILIRGFQNTSVKKPSGGDKLPKGDYYISGVTVADNILTTTYQAVNLQNTRNAVIESNRITCKGSGSASDMIGIEIASRDISITGNTVKNAFKNAIGLHNDSTVKLIAKNKLTSPRENGIFIDSSTAEEISGNKITKAKGVGIAVGARSSASLIKKNTISSASAGGISISESGTELVVFSNTIKSCGSAQITLYGGGKQVSISKNTLKGKSGADGILCTGGTVLVDNNKISSCRFATLFTDNVKGTVAYNKCSKNQHNDVSIGFGETKKYFSKPSSLKAKVSGKSAKLSWKSVKGAKGYQIFRSTEKNGIYTKVGNTSKTSFKNSKLKRKTTYYYKVIAYQQSGNLLIAGDYSNIVSAKTK